MQRRVWSAWSLNSTISLPSWEDYTGVQFVTEWCLRYCSSCISSVDRYSLRSLTVWISCWFPGQRLKPAVTEPCQSGTLPVEWVSERHQESIWQLTFLEQIYGLSRVHFGFYHRIDTIINNIIVQAFTNLFQFIFDFFVFLQSEFFHLLSTLLRGGEEEGGALYQRQS